MVVSQKSVSPPRDKLKVVESPTEQGPEAGPVIGLGQRGVISIHAEAPLLAMQLTLWWGALAKVSFVLPIRLTRELVMETEPSGEHVTLPELLGELLELALAMRAITEPIQTCVNKTVHPGPPQAGPVMSQTGQGPKQGRARTMEAGELLELALPLHAIQDISG